MCWQKAHVVNHIIYKTVQYAMILHLVLNEEPQQHINLTVHWCNQRVLFHSRLFNSSWAFMITLIISIIFLLHISSWPQNCYLESTKNKSPPENCPETRNQQESDPNMLQATSKELLKKCSFIISITCLNKCSSIHI